MELHRKAKIGILVLLLSLTAPLGAEIFLGYTIDSWPPFMYVDQGRVTGIATEIAREVFRGCNIYVSIEAVPWPRAMKTVHDEAGTFMYILYRTTERENQFKWVGPIVAPVKTSFYKLKKREDIQLSNIEDAKKFVVGVVRGVANHDYLLQQDFSEGVNMEAVTNPEQNISKLILGRIDLILNTEYTLPRLLDGTGLNMADFEVALEAVESEAGYIALNISTPDSLIDDLNDSLNRLRTWGTIDSIYSRFLKD
ncbi:MAG: transporter substrate-binding domain-containing protein [Spirochaetales bacterium]|nr:transporter substrate-binding domain-containing protein [Spirochaetales bacterium]